MYLRRAVMLLALMSLAAALAGPAYASNKLPTPGKPVLLEVTGKITVTNEVASARFDREMLNAHPPFLHASRLQISLASCNSVAAEYSAH